MVFGSGHWDIKFLAHGLIGWKLVGRLVSRLVDWSVGWSVGRWSVGRSVVRESWAAYEEGVIVVGYRTNSQSENKRSIVGVEGRETLMH